MIEDLGGEPWVIQTEGMRASDVGDALDNERLAKMIAAAPALMKACRAAAEDYRHFMPATGAATLTLIEEALALVDDP